MTLPLFVEQAIEVWNSDRGSFVEPKHLGYIMNTMEEHGGIFHMHVHFSTSGPIDTIVFVLLDKTRVSLNYKGQVIMEVATSTTHDITQKRIS